MILNIIYFIGGFAVGIGVMIAYCLRTGKKMLKRIGDAPSYAQKEMFDAIRDVADPKTKP